MSYKKENIKSGVCLHTIETDKFKTNLFALMLTTKINKQNATKNALVSLILRRGTKNLQSQEEISKKLEDMYGANFDCGIDKIGDNHVIKFYLESLNDNYLPEKDNNFEKSLETILEIVFNPQVENNKFKEEYFKLEKEKLKQIIEGKKDNKSVYAFNRCIEEMYKDKPFGIYKFGTLEELEKITNEELYNYYQELIKTCKIDIFVSGDIKENIKEKVEENENIRKLQEREADYIKDSMQSNFVDKENIVEEKLDITQGKLVIGIDLKQEDENSKNIALVYNGILGGTANSKLFQNVREKASLAYTASSNYLRQKANIFIRCGIEIGNYEKALKIIKEQLEDMKNGNFTEEEIQNTKQCVISTVQGIPDEQDTEITYYFGQELTGTQNSIDEYIQNIKSVTKEQIIDLANTVKINTIYFLRN